MKENRVLPWDKQINLLLYSRRTATRTGLESMLSFSSQRIAVCFVNSYGKIARKLKTANYDCILFCINERADDNILEFLKMYSSLPVVIIDTYYNRELAKELVAAGATEYLDISTLDSRLLIKTINYSIQNKMAENQAVQAEKRMKIRSTFLANMSHEIRTPLNSIIGFSELLYEEEGDAVKREKLNMIRQSGKHLLTLINGILDFSKLEAGKIKADKEEFSIDNLVMTLYYMMLVKSGDRNIDLNIKPVGRIPELVEGDEFRINQVLINLMNNAIKFTTTGSVTLEYGYEDGAAVFRVIDTGIGIPSHKLEHIFDAFEQVYNVGSLPKQGTGLGLAISRNLVHLMKGTITVESIPGKGSVFTVIIPLPVKRWDSPKPLIKLANNFPARKLGIIYHSEEHRQIINNWCEAHQIDFCWADDTQWQDEEFLDCDVFLFPQDISRKYRQQLISFFAINPRVSFKQKVFYLQKGKDFFFLLPDKTINSNYLKIDAGKTEQNFTPEEFIIFLNNWYQKVEEKGKEMLKTWKHNFEQENPGLEDVLYEAFMRMHEKLGELNKAAAENDNNRIETIAHSLKGFTGQTCIYEVSNRASILLDEIRNSELNPKQEIIRRELSLLNEIEYLLPRRILGIKSRLGVSKKKKVLPDFTPMKILVAEDNPINQAVIKDFLRHFQLECTLVENGEEVLNQLKMESYDLLFLDIQMPVMDGVEALKLIKEQGLREGLYVVALSAYILDENHNNFLRKNCDAFLSKPFERKNLLEVLQKAAESKDKYREYYEKPEIL